MVISVKVLHRHDSQYLNFHGILEFVGPQLVASSVIFSKPPCSVADVFSDIVATQLRWCEKVCMHLEATIFRILCAKNYNDQFKLLEFLEEN